MCASVCSLVPRSVLRAIKPGSTRPRRQCPFLLRYKVQFQSDIGISHQTALMKEHDYNSIFNSRFYDNPMRKCLPYSNWKQRGMKFIVGSKMTLPFFCSSAKNGPKDLQTIPTYRYSQRLIAKLFNEGSTIYTLKTRYLEGMFFQQASSCFHCNMTYNHLFLRFYS